MTSLGESAGSFEGTVEGWHWTPFREINAEIAGEIYGVFYFGRQLQLEVLLCQITFPPKDNWLYPERSHISWL